MYNRINKFKTFIFIGVFVYSQNTQAQITDYIIDEISNKVSSYISNAASNFWDSMVESDARNSIIEQSKELRNYNIEETQLDNLYSSSNFSRESVAGTEIITSIPNRISSNFWDEINSVSHIKLTTLGNGLINDAVKNYKDSITNSMRINSLEKVLAKSVIDEIASITITGFRDTLLNDINHENRLALLLNNHPEVLKVYANSFNTNLRNNLAHLYYWGVRADSHKDKLPKKNKIINPREIIFEDYGANIRLLYHDNVIGVFYAPNNDYDIRSELLLDLLPQSNCIYNLGHTRFTTDILGRVVSIDFLLNKKSKVVSKGTVNYKKLCLALNVEKGQDLYSLLLKGYKESPSAAFAIKIEDIESFKVPLKVFKKKAKEILKSSENAVASIVIRYDLYDKPSYIGSRFANTNSEEYICFLDTGNHPNTQKNNQKEKELEIIKSIMETSTRFVVVNGTHLRIRLAPSLSAETLKDSNNNNIHLEKGLQLPYLGDQDDFFRIMYQGKVGYISKKYSNLSN